MFRNALILSILFAVPAFAQPPASEAQPADQPPQKPADPQPDNQAKAPDLNVRMAQRPGTWSLNFPAELGLSAGIVDQPGDVSTTHLGAEFGVAIPLGTRSELSLGFDYEYSRYEFTNTANSIAGTSSPFRDINRETFRARFGTQETRQLSWLVGGSVGFSAENGANVGDSVVGNLYGGVGYYLNEHLKVGGALVVYQRLERSPLVLPIPSLDWQIDEQWRLTNAGKPGLTLFYTPEPQWTFSFGAWYESRNFRLAENGPIPNGVGRESSVPVEGGLTFRPSRNISASVGIGVHLLQNYQVDDSSGDNLADFDANASAYLKLALEWKF